MSPTDYFPYRKQLFDWCCLLLQNFAEYTIGYTFPGIAFALYLTSECMSKLTDYVRVSSLHWLLCAGGFDSSMTYYQVNSNSCDNNFSMRVCGIMFQRHVDLLTYDWSKNRY